MAFDRFEEDVKLSSQPKKGGQDLQYLRANNLWVLLSSIREHGPLSRLDLAYLTGLAPSSVTRMVQALSELGLIVEVGKGKSSGGRQPVLITTNPAAGLVISLDLSGPHILGGVFDAANHLIKAVDQPFNELGPTAIQRQILSLIRDLLEGSMAQDHPLLGIGVSLPGAVDLETGDVQTSYNLRLQNFPLRRILKAEFGLPVYIEHDASVAALAEQYYGAGRGKDYMIYILVSTGIGSGIILNGQIFRGETGKSGEFGHIIVDADGQLCVCGKRGCLEAVAAAPAMLTSARWMVTHGRADVLSSLCEDDPEKLTIEILAQAARLRDPVAEDIFARSADYLAQGLSIYTSIMDIQWIVVGGEVAETGDVFFTPLYRAIDKYRRNGLEIKVTPAELKHNTFLQGISMLTLQEVLRSQVLQLR